MFYTDWFFLSLLIGLPLLSFMSFNCLSLRYSPELFFSAVGAASIIVLAWERIAEGRGTELRLLMERIYSDKGEIKLQRVLALICSRVKDHYGMEPIEFNMLLKTVLILKRSGRFHDVDRLYPKKAMNELSVLLKWVNEYAKDNEDFKKDLRERYDGKFYDHWYHVLRVMKGDAGIRFDGHEYYSYSKPDGSRVPSWPRFGQENGLEFLALVEELKKESCFFARIEDSTWRREILERASRIRDIFVQFLEKHGVEPPPGYDMDWIGGGAVTSYTGPIF